MNEDHLMATLNKIQTDLRELRQETSQLKLQVTEKFAEIRLDGKDSVRSQGERIGQLEATVKVLNQKLLALAVAVSFGGFIMATYVMPHILHARDVSQQSN